MGYGDRLKRALALKGWSQSELARQIGLRPQAIQYLCSVETSRSRHTVAIARALGVSADWLDTGHGDMVHESNVAPGPKVRAHVPLVSWVQAGHWCGIVDNYQPGDGEKLIPVTKNVGDHAFALRVQGDSMEPVFPAGSIIIVDPNQRAENGSYVVVRLEDEVEATFKQLVIDGGKKYLKPLNPRYPIMQVNGNATICGVVRQMVMDFD